MVVWGRLYRAEWSCACGCEGGWARRSLAAWRVSCGKRVACVAWGASSLG